MGRADGSGPQAATIQYPATSIQYPAFPLTGFPLLSNQEPVVSLK